jgi:hypothetical protein
MPIHISPGIAGDVDPSTTLDKDVKVISKLIEGIVLNKESRGTLFEEVTDSLDDKWTTVGPGGRPLKAKNSGSTEHQESGSRG